MTYTPVLDPQVDINLMRTGFIEEEQFKVKFRISSKESDRRYALAISLYEEGWLLREIASAVKVTQSTMRRFLRKYRQAQAQEQAEQGDDLATESAHGTESASNGSTAAGLTSRTPQRRGRSPDSDLEMPAPKSARHADPSSTDGSSTPDIHPQYFNVLDFTEAQWRALYIRLRGAAAGAAAS